MCRRSKTKNKNKLFGIILRKGGEIHLFFAIVLSDLQPLVHCHYVLSDLQSESFEYKDFKSATNISSHYKPTDRFILNFFHKNIHAYKTCLKLVGCELTTNRSPFCINKIETINLTY